MSAIETANVRQPWEERAAELVRRLHTDEEELNVDLIFELDDILPEEDGMPMESPWHRAAMNLLIDILVYFWRDRDDFFVGGNMFVYYLRRGFPLPKNRGPDFFYVSGVERHYPRKKWSAFIEGKFPEVIVEFLSPSTSREDRTVKKDVYEEHFMTEEYFLYDPKSCSLEGWRLKSLNHSKKYQPISADERGWMWSERLGMWLGPWQGEFQGVKAAWPRFYDKQGQLIRTEAEAEKLRADSETKRADDEKKRADEAAVELTLLRARLKELE